MQGRAGSGAAGRTLPEAAEADEVLAAPDWAARAESHRRRADDFLTPQLRRQHAGEPHPVWDFLFTYYSLRPRQLRRWHPGFGVVLSGKGADEYPQRTGYGPHARGVTVSHDYLLFRRETVRFVARLMRATATRAPLMNCFGLHEWAMVYRTPELRHGQVPLRLGGVGTDAVVESMPLRCTHFDAFRFFTDAAVSRNDRQLSRDQQIDAEQPGCIHAAMDTYKWAYKLGPLVPSELVMDCARTRGRRAGARYVCQPIRLDAVWFPADRHRNTGRAC